MNPWPTKDELWDRLELAARRALDEPENAAVDANWYQRQKEWLIGLIRKGGDTATPEALRQAAGIVAVLSPQVSWGTQRKYIPGVLVGLPQGRPINHPGFRINVRKARAISNGDFNVLRGPKVTAFAANLSGNFDAVTVDSQMLDVAVGCDPSSRPHLTARRYREVATAITGLADRFGYKPAQMQAIVWGWHRRNNRGRTD